MAESAQPSRKRLFGLFLHTLLSLMLCQFVLTMCAYLLLGWIPGLGVFSPYLPYLLWGWIYGAYCAPLEQQIIRLVFMVFILAGPFQLTLMMSSFCCESSGFDPWIRALYTALNIYAAGGLGVYLRQHKEEILALLKKPMGRMP